MHKRGAHHEQEAVTRGPGVGWVLGLLLIWSAPAAWANRQPPAAQGVGAESVASESAQRDDGTISEQQKLEDAVAAIVVVALTEQLDSKQISVAINRYDASVATARERYISGSGTVQIKGDNDPLRFRYRTLYDVVAGTAAYPKISLAGVDSGAERSVPNDSALIGELDRRVAAALSKELGGARIWLQLDTIETYESGSRYVRINATGVADLGMEGTTPTRVEALYDRQKATWLRVNYQLGEGVKGVAAALDGA